MYRVCYYIDRLKIGWVAWPWWPKFKHGQKTWSLKSGRGLFMVKLLQISFWYRIWQHSEKCIKYHFIERYNITFYLLRVLPFYGFSCAIEAYKEKSQNLSATLYWVGYIGWIWCKYWYDMFGKLQALFWRLLCKKKISSGSDVRFEPETEAIFGYQIRGETILGKEIREKKSCRTLA